MEKKKQFNFVCKEKYTHHMYIWEQSPHKNQRIAGSVPWIVGDSEISLIEF